MRRINPDCVVQIVNNGSEAIAYLQGDGRYANRAKFQFPGYIITDLKMPGADGFEVLSFLKHNTTLSVIPMVVLSGSSDEDDIRQAYALGASGYLVKPQDTQGLVRRLKLLYEFFSECEVPEVTASGHEVATSSEGKIAQRFSGAKNWSRVEAVYWHRQGTRCSRIPAIWHLCHQEIYAIQSDNA